MYWFQQFLPPIYKKWFWYGHPALKHKILKTRWVPTLETRKYTNSLPKSLPYYSHLIKLWAKEDPTLSRVHRRVQSASTIISSLLKLGRSMNDCITRASTYAWWAVAAASKFCAAAIRSCSCAYPASITSTYQMAINWDSHLRIHKIKNLSYEQIGSAFLSKIGHSTSEVWLIWSALWLCIQHRNVAP